ncbi:MAG: universal stress protein [Saprospiraceae bacterium]|nr:universal stress protein [Saprospiraceae bacterium]
MEAIERTHILIPTDLEECAERALQTAMTWAAVTPVYLHLCHAVAGMPDDWDAWPAEEKAQHGALARAVKRAEEAFAEWGRELVARQIPGTFELWGGVLLDRLQAYLRTQSIDYVFIGARGSHARKYDRLGSHAEQIVRAVGLPVLVAKDRVPVSIRSVIFASTFDNHAKASFARFLRMIQPFTPTVHLLNIDSPSFYTEPQALIVPAMQEFRAMAAGFDCQLHVYPDQRVERGILEFSQEIGADLIALARWSDRLFPGDRLNKGLVRLIHSPGVPVVLIDEHADNPD